MRRKHKEPPTPVERFNTIRKYIVTLLEENTLSAKDIAVYLRIPEKDVSNHLEHIRKTLSKSNQRLTVMPPNCEKCGFEFKKRERFTKPGKCPVCHSTLIRPPLFSIKSAGQD